MRTNLSLGATALLLFAALGLAACAATPRIIPVKPAPEPNLIGTFVGVCSGMDPSAPCIHEVPDGWTMMTAGPQVSGDGMLVSDSVRRSVLVKRHEVTQEEWSWLMRDNPSFFGGCADCPVERVSWWDALTYLNRLSLADGFQPCYELQGCAGTVGSGCPGGRPWCESSYRCEAVHFAGEQCTGYRLPTADEWRWVAEATAGDEEIVSFPWCADISQGRPRPVSRLSADAVDGIAGNVWEWTWDAPEGDDRRAHRGGSFRTAPGECGAEAKSTAESVVRSYFVGFRPMRTLPYMRRATPRAVAHETAQAGRRGILTPPRAP